MVARGTIDFSAAVGACMVGIFSGDLLLFLIGRLFGPALLAQGGLRWLVDEASLQRARQWFLRRGGAVIFASRFVPGTRLPSYLVAGALRMPILHFSLYFLAAALIWTPLLVGLAYVAGANALELLDGYQRYGLPVLLILAGTLWLLLRLGLSRSPWRPDSARDAGAAQTLSVEASVAASGATTGEIVTEDRAYAPAEAQDSAFLAEAIDRAKLAVCERYGIDAGRVSVASMGGRHGGLGNAIPLPIPFFRRYLVRYHRGMRNADALAIRGLMAHELMHVLQYSRASFAELLSFMLRYLKVLIVPGSGRGADGLWLRHIEHLTDLTAVEMGEGAAIAAWKRYKNALIDRGELIDSLHTVYLSASEIDLLDRDRETRQLRIRETLAALNASDPCCPLRSARQ